MIGYKVAYWPSPARKWRQHDEKKPLLAFITQDVTDDIVNLTVFAHNGEQFNAEDVILYKGNGLKPQWSYCETL